MYTQPGGRLFVRISKWGNSLGLRIPAPFARETGIDEGTEVDIALDGGRIIITPPGPRYTLDALLDGVTPENVHEGVETGPRRGAEVW
ncbi:MAG: AbrB/MazE/SpoVT family DNA-binding domain-containing protein [Longimicrobiales bacterium]